MKNSIYALIAVIFMLIAGGCSDRNTDAPLPGQIHPAGWLVQHAAAANADLNSCQGCHGVEFSGSGNAVNCFNCHSSGPPFTSVHPGGWVDVVADHQTFAQTISWTTCATAACHGPTLEGGSTGPSCFNVACHGPQGNPPAPHALPFTAPTAHGPTAKPDQIVCRNCHGRPESNFNGGFVADLYTDPVGVEINPSGNCNLCHPSASAHPTNWQGTNDPGPAYAASHRGIDETTQERSCALCHLTTGPGTGPVPTAPSCFTANHTNEDNSTTICHGSGPLTAPHPVDGSYQAPAAHGRDARQDLVACQNCHAVPGTSGPGSNPRFNVTIGTLATGCETCHPPFYAHPATWAGPDNNVFHYLSGNIANACTLCHGVNLDGIGGVNAAGGTPGQSCLVCHADTTLFNLDCTACHGYPPDGVTAEPLVAALGGALVNHGAVAAVGSHDQCAVCHGVKSSNTGSSGHLSPNANYLTFDVLTGVPGDHWNGQINMNGPSPTTGTGYNQTNFGCDNAGCHGNDAAHRLSNSALTVQFADYGGEGGGTAPHALDGSFLLPANHGPSARANLVACKACHGQASTTNPRYNVGIGGTGCETCHNTNTAHPSAGTRENVRWYDGQWRHSNGTKSTFAAACSMCHTGLGGTGTVGPACTSCHRASPITNNSGCVSCHSVPPNGAGVAGALTPNRRGRHAEGRHSSEISNTPLNTCAVCHGAAFGPGNVNHFDQTTGATVIMTGVGAGISISQSGGNTTCNGNCHGENHSSERWY
ncbi:MAG: hypothetical protein CVU69_05310 [Deltaproteobacteria bacterium HGW-Deltaproteobacteria-4]|nr:MAG: hypothetical protein CVU69_05310 [Deltaproteobacteria bacterium HGW-Deltaproteobacteria-4]